MDRDPGGRPHDVGSGPVVVIEVPPGPQQRHVRRPGGYSVRPGPKSTRPSVASMASRWVVARVRERPFSLQVRDSARRPSARRTVTPRHRRPATKALRSRPRRSGGMADAAVLNTAARKGVRVRISAPAPRSASYWQLSERGHGRTRLSSATASGEAFDGMVWDESSDEGPAMAPAASCGETRSCWP
jgi:hypothetical protein